MNDMEDWEKAVKHFGSSEATHAACTGFGLGDAIKECNLNNLRRPRKVGANSP